MVLDWKASSPAVPRYPVRPRVWHSYMRTVQGCLARGKLPCASAVLIRYVYGTCTVLIRYTGGRYAHPVRVALYGYVSTQVAAQVVHEHARRRRAAGVVGAVRTGGLQPHLMPHEQLQG